jgi:hypothetical protein
MFGDYVIETVLPVEGEIQRYRIERGGQRSILYCRGFRGATEEQTGAFTQRVKALAAFIYPHVPAVEAAGYVPQPGFFWIRAAAPRGRSLRDILDERSEPLEDTYCLSLFHAVARLLALAFAKQVLHFGLTPSDIYVTDDAELELKAVTGLGIRMTLDATPAALRLEELIYRAPEQLRPQRADHRADIYALGMILYELLAGGPPYEEPFAKAGIKAQGSAPLESVLPVLLGAMPVSLRERAEVSSEWEAFVFSDRKDHDHG